MRNLHFNTFVPHRKHIRTSRLAGQCFLIIPSVILFMRLPLTSSQDFRPFPPLYNIAQNRPVSTSPADSTCGLPTRNAYCRSSVFNISVQQCVQDFCVQTCPDRTTLPNFNDVLISTSDGFGQCVTTDTVNTRPTSLLGEFSMFFVKAGPTCFLTPSSDISLGTDGAFTMSFWLWYDTANSG